MNTINSAALSLDEKIAILRNHICASEACLPSGSVYIRFDLNDAKLSIRYRILGEGETCSIVIADDDNSRERRAGMAACFGMDPRNAADISELRGIAAAFLQDAKEAFADEQNPDDFQVGGFGYGRDAGRFSINYGPSGYNWTRTEVVDGAQYSCGQRFLHAKATKDDILAAFDAADS